MNISPVQDNVTAALRAFLTAVVPAGVPVILGQQNRVPEPQAGDFVIMTPIQFTRLATNQDGNADCKITGSISGNILTVTQVLDGAIVIGATLFGTGVAANTTILSQLSGTGYQVSISQTAPQQTMSAGTKTMTQEAEVVVQLDFHSVDTSAADMAQTVSTALRDEFGVNFFAGLAPPLNGVVPLYADDPKQTPFINDQQQYEWRWTLDAYLQVNQIVAVPSQYADSADVVLQDVNSKFFPP